jgi:hypothetical protein
MRFQQRLPPPAPQRRPGPQPLPLLLLLAIAAAAATRAVSASVAGAAAAAAAAVVEEVPQQHGAVAINVPASTVRGTPSTAGNNQVLQAQLSLSTVLWSQSTTSTWSTGVELCELVS